MKLMIEDVGQQYRRDFWGLHNFSVELARGVLGLLGPNGTGKSTLMCTCDLRVMSPNPDTAEIYEKLLFLQGFRFYGSNVPEEQLFTKSSITRLRIVVKSFAKIDLMQ